MLVTQTDNAIDSEFHTGLPTQEKKIQNLKGIENKSYLLCNCRVPNRYSKKKKKKLTTPLTVKRGATVIMLTVTLYLSLILVSDRCLIHSHHSGSRLEVDRHSDIKWLCSCCKSSINSCWLRNKQINEKRNLWISANVTVNSTVLQLHYNCSKIPPVYVCTMSLFFFGITDWRLSVAFSQFVYVFGIFLF